MTKEELVNELNKRIIPFNESSIDELFSFMGETLSTNEKFNLTAIKDREEFVEKMIFDSAIALQNLDLTNKKVIDVGTGAGYPGLVLYILNKNIEMTLLDSTKKKIDYLSEYCQKNNYSLSFVATRAEQFAHLHHDYDYAFARAVAALNILIELIVPMLKVGGYFIALKGVGYEEEIKMSQNALKKLNCHIEKVIVDELPICKEQRVMIYIKKDRENVAKYPREYTEIKRKPL